MADLCGLSAETKQYIAVGFQAYQVFAFFKAARTRVNWNGACFVAGTQVLVAPDEGEGYTTRSIETIQPGDLVLSRNQYDPSDDLDPRPVTQVFVHTSDHERVLTIRDANGKIETIRTTDSHPFYVEGKSWVEAGRLQVGEALGEADESNQSIVVGTERIEHPEGLVIV